MIVAFKSLKACSLLCCCHICGRSELSFLACHLIACSFESRIRFNFNTTLKSLQKRTVIFLTFGYATLTLFLINLEDITHFSFYLYGKNVSKASKFTIQTLKSNLQLQLSKQFKRALQSKLSSCITFSSQLRAKIITPPPRVKGERKLFQKN